MNIGVYEIRNMSNGHVYIGSSVNLSARWLRHQRDLAGGKHHSYYLQRAWNKYGGNMFSFNPLLICSRDNLLFYEQKIIEQSMPQYNLAKIAGAPMSGRAHSQEARAKMSTTRTGIKFSGEHRRNIAAAKLGIKRAPFSAEWIAKMSANRKGELHPNAKLSTAQVIEIRKDQRTFSEIAIEFRVTKSAINHIKSGRNWTHI